MAPPIRRVETYTELFMRLFFNLKSAQYAIVLLALTVFIHWFVKTCFASQPSPPAKTKDDPPAKKRATIRSVGIVSIPFRVIKFMVSCGWCTRAGQAGKKAIRSTLRGYTPPRTLSMSNQEEWAAT